MAAAGLVCVVLAGIVMAALSILGRRPAMVRRLGRAVIAGPIAALVLLVLGCVLLAIGTEGVGRILASIGAVLALALAGFSVGLLVLRLRAPRVENVAVSRDGIVLHYTSGLVTMRWEDLTSLEPVEPQGAMPGGIGYRIRASSPSQKALPFSSRLIARIARQPYDGLLALPGGPREVEAMLKRLRRYMREPGARRELPGPGGSMGAPPTVGDVRGMAGRAGVRTGGISPRQGPGPKQGGRRG
ncbi:MAG: hypothetical protein NVSMB65_00420 [Chloroflexota bacterium]